MILPSQPSSLHGGEDQTLPPPSYQESVPPSQLLPRERPTASLYAPSVSSRPGPSDERDNEPAPRFTSLDEKDPSIDYSEPPPLPPKDKGKDLVVDSPTQRVFDMFSSMVLGAQPAASTSRSPSQAGSSSRTVATQDPLNPAPAAFTRPTPKNYAYLPFKPMTMLGISSDLADGFPTIPPPINPEDEKQTGKTSSQHPFVSHDVTEDDWLKFLTGIKTVASSPNQTQKSFLARMFHGEMNERDQRKRAVHFADSWNHYFFQPRRMTVVLARGRKIFNGASGNHPHRRHSVGCKRGRDTDPNHTNLRRHRSHSTDSSSSDSSTSSSDSSVHSTTSEPPQMPVPHTENDYGSGRGPGGWDHGMGRGWGPRGRGFGGPLHHGWHGGRGRGWCSPGPCAVPPVPGMGGGMGRGGHWQSHGPNPWQSHSYRDQKLAWKGEKHAWKIEKRAMKHAHRQVKRAMRHEKRQRRMEARAMRYGGHSSHKRDQPWKLIISFHGAHRDSGQS